MSVPTAVTEYTSPYVGTRAGLTNVLRSEWTKLWSVRSTMWTLLTMFVVTVGLGVLIAWGISSNINQMSAADRATFDPTTLSLAGLSFGQLAMVVLGALFLTTEYSTGGIRTSLTAVPRRLRVVAAKAIVLAVVTFVAGVITSFVAFFIGQAFFGSVDLAASLGDPGVLRAVIGGGLYLLASALFGFAIGVLLRHSAGAITAGVALLLVVPPLTMLLPGDWGDAVTRYFTSNAGQQITAVTSVGDVLSPWNGYLVFTLWWVVILAVGSVLMVRRDA
jgi:hypothetical protein